jgi:hypothetical protein
VISRVRVLVDAYTVLAGEAEDLVADVALVVSQQGARSSFASRAKHDMKGLLRIQRATLFAKALADIAAVLDAALTLGGALIRVEIELEVHERVFIEIE